MFSRGEWEGLDQVAEQVVVEVLIIAFGDSAQRSLQRQALEILEKLAQENPTVSEYKYQLSRSHVGIAAVLGSLGRSDAALVSLKAAERLLESLVEGNAQSSEAQELLTLVRQGIEEIED